MHIVDNIIFLSFFMDQNRAFHRFTVNLKIIFPYMKIARWLWLNVQANILEAYYKQYSFNSE